MSRSAVHSYRVYGVRIISDTLLDLPAADAPWRIDHSATVAFVSGCEDDFAGVTMQGDDAFACSELPDGRIDLCWRGWYEFIVAANGARVTHRPLDGCDRTVFEN